MTGTTTTTPVSTITTATTTVTTIETIYLVPWFFSKYEAFSQMLFLLGNTERACAYIARAHSYAPWTAHCTQTCTLNCNPLTKDNSRLTRTNQQHN